MYPNFASELDKIIYVADYIWQDIISKCTQSLQAFGIEHLPVFIKYKGLAFSVRFPKRYSGKACENYVGNYPLLSTETSICVGFGLNASKCAIFLREGNACAIFKENNESVVFVSQVKRFGRSWY